MIFWATACIVNGVWAATGTVDGGTLLQVALEGWLFLQLHRAEKRQQVRA